MTVAMIIRPIELRIAAWLAMAMSFAAFAASTAGEPVIGWRGDGSGNFANANPPLHSSATIGTTRVASPPSGSGAALSALRSGVFAQPRLCVPVSLTRILGLGAPVRVSQSPCFLLASPFPTHRVLPVRVPRLSTGTMRTLRPPTRHNAGLVCLNRRFSATDCVLARLRRQSPASAW
jgi:hypothetical protein